MIVSPKYQLYDFNLRTEVVYQVKQVTNFATESSTAIAIHLIFPNLLGQLFEDHKKMFLDHMI